MSHIAESAVKPGEPLIRDLRALARACERLELEFVLPKDASILARTQTDGSVLTTVVNRQGLPTPNDMHFRSYQDDHGGRNRLGRGNNAIAVIRLNPAQRAAAIAKHETAPYEIGVVKDSANPGCYLTQHDDFCEGYGLEEIVGKTTTDSKGKVVEMTPTLLMHYAMACDQIVAEERGDELVFKPLEDGSWVGTIIGAEEVGVAPLFLPGA